MHDYVCIYDYAGLSITTSYRCDGCDKVVSACECILICCFFYIAKSHQFQLARNMGRF